MDNLEEKSTESGTEYLVDREQIEEDRRKNAEQQKTKAEKRLARKKKRIRRALIILLIIVVIAGVTVGIVVWKNKEANTETTIEVEVNKGETVQYAEIVSIVGNEMTVRYTDAGQTDETAAEDGSTDRNSEEKSENGMPDMSSMPGGGDGTEASDTESSSDTTDDTEKQGRPDMGSMPGGGDGNGMPDMSSMPGGGDGEMPDMGSMPGGGDGNGMPDMGASTGETTASEEVALTIPVGTDVYTKLGTVTTFSRLSAGNSIAMIFEEGTENILRIYIQ